MSSTKATAIVIMGVSGSGKTTIGLLLAGQMGWRFQDADDLHPVENIRQMREGIPLTDKDREPWLSAIKMCIAESISAQRSIVVACSALKASYREAISVLDEGVVFIHLAGDFRLIHERVSKRRSHFMSAKLLESQFATLEVEDSLLTCDISKSPEDIVRQIRKFLNGSSLRTSENRHGQK